MVDSQVFLTVLARVRRLRDADVRNSESNHEYSYEVRGRSEVDGGAMVMRSSTENGLGDSTPVSSIIKQTQDPEPDARRVRGRAKARSDNMHGVSVLPGLRLVLLFGQGQVVRPRLDEKW